MLKLDKTLVLFDTFWAKYFDQWPNKENYMSHLLWSFQKCKTRGHQRILKKTFFPIWKHTYCTYRRATLHSLYRKCGLNSHKWVWNSALYQIHYLKVMMRRRLRIMWFLYVYTNVIFKSKRNKNNWLVAPCFQSPEDFSPKKKYTLGLGSGCEPEPKPKAKIDSEFNSIHFGI